jgi:Flp pilus assembly protein TadG
VFALWLAVIMPVLIALFALLIESANLFFIRHRQQTATDAAALAAAHQSLGRERVGVVAAARYISARNGFAADANTIIDVETPPASGAYSGDARAVRGTLTHQPLRVLTAIFPDVLPTITTTATARLSRAICLLTLAPSTPGSLTVAANSLVDAPVCSTHVNSQAASALNIGNRATVTFLDLRVAGTANISGSAVVMPIPETLAGAIADPLESLPEVTTSGCDFNNRVVSGTQTLAPGTYCGGIRVNANARATLQAGDYKLVGGSLELRNKARIDGTNVTLHLLQGARLLMNTSALVSLAAADSGPYRGILFFESRNAPLDAVTHNIPLRQASLLQGVIYLPRSALSLISDTKSAANQGSAALAIVARNVSLGGRIGINFDPHALPDQLRHKTWLVE